MPRTLRRALLLLALVPLTSACFRYVRSEVAPVPVGENVRLTLTQEGMSELRALSPEADPVVAGTVMSWSGDALMLRLPTRRDPALVYGEAVGQDVRIPTAAIVQLERRRVDGVRTAAATVLGVGAIATAIVVIVSDAFGSEDLTPPGPDQQLGSPPFALPAR